MPSELDKIAERDRYNKHAIDLLRTRRLSDNLVGINSIPLYLQSPYIEYAKEIKSRLTHESSVVEIGSGYGRHTHVLLESGAKVFATDISVNSIEILSKYYAHYDNLIATVMDMESLEFKDASMDMIVSAGSLSYGDNEVVMNEIYRVLKPGGFFICVDSLNENPIYRANRFLAYLMGKRSKSTLIRMPSIKLLKKFEGIFSHVEIKFYGSTSFLMPFLARLCGHSYAKKFSDWYDFVANIKFSAFKFVMIAKK